MSDSNNTAVKQAKNDVDNAKSDVAAKAGETIDKVKQGIQTKVDQLGETTNNYKEKVSDNLSSASEKVHHGSDTAHGFLNDKADVINDYAHQTIEKANEIGHRAADVLANSSDYIKNFDVAETRRQVKDTIKEKPELSIAVAAVFGLLIGLLISRKKD